MTRAHENPFSHSSMESPPSSKEAMQDDGAADDSGIIMELDTTTTTSSASSTTTTPCKVSRIGIRKQRKLAGNLKQSNNSKSTVTMARKLVKKAIKTRPKMENNQNRRHRHSQLLEQLCRENYEHTNDETKRDDYEEPPPRPPTRRCMFYREDTEVVAKILRSKQA
uniref:Cyclin-dependent kinase inhibitor n=2 Tax=Caenorhabditis tropicalis TaxID=1561998 RepID=A0A1I7TZI2_9PELO